MNGFSIGGFNVKLIILPQILTFILLVVKFADDFKNLS